MIKQASLQGPKIPASLDDLARNFHSRIYNAVKIATQDSVYIAKTEFLNGPPPDILTVKSGRLRGSIVGETKDDGHNITGVLRAGGPGIPYAMIHEKGGYIRKRGKKGGAFWMRARPYIKPSIKAVVPYLRSKLSSLQKGT